MKFVAIALTVLGIHCAGAASTLPAGSVGIVGNFIAIRSADCEVIYYAPRIYSIVESQSSILLYSKITQGKLNPLIRLTFALRPKPSEPSVEDQRAIKAWASSSSSNCSAADARFEAYPTTLQNLSTPLQAYEEGALAAHSAVLPDGGQILYLDVRPDRISLPQLLKRLDYVRAELNISMFSLQTQIEVWLEADYQAVAQFALQHYTERTCTTTKKCKSLLGFEKCEPSEECRDVAKLVQTFQAMQSQQGINLGLVTEPSADSQQIADLQSQLFSRLILSLFAESSRREFGEVSNIVIGDLKRSIHGRYFDRLTKVKMVNQTFVEPIDDLNLMRFSELPLARLYRENKWGKF